MSDPRRILVVSGARALSRTPAARLWALAEIIAAMRAHGADTVCHGACIGSPDEWSNDLARMARIGTVTWPLSPPRARVWAPGMAPRNLLDGERYPYDGPLDRNAAMTRWAGDQSRAGHDVRALTLRCPWPLVDGERATQVSTRESDQLVRALGAERVTDLVCPEEFGP